MPFRDGVVWDRLKTFMRTHKSAKRCAERLNINPQQFMALLQFCDTGPYFSSTKKLHDMLKDRWVTSPYAPPKPPLSYEDLKRIMAIIR